MTFDPKPISRAGVPAALQKAERYRLINDPSSAESICLDVLEVDPGNQQAVVTLILAITDNAIIPLKERVVDEFFDPVGRLLKVFSRRETEA